jgi:hypothetical protein
MYVEQTLDLPGAEHVQLEHTIRDDELEHTSDTHHHHQITKLSHSINAIGPAPHRSGRKREHRSIVFATITRQTLSPARKMSHFIRVAPAVGAVGLL